MATAHCTGPGSVSTSQSLSQQLSQDEQRTVSEGLSEPELAVFDLLTQPAPVLTAEQRDEVKKIARRLMSHIQDRLVLDWRKKAQTREASRVLVKDVLEELPDAYDPQGPAVRVEKAGDRLDDLGVIKPPSSDGFVNWRTTHLIAAPRHTAVMRTRTRINRVRMNNSTQALPEIEVEDYVRDHWR